MKFLFVHQNFPGQFVHIVRHLLATGEHDVVFITGVNGNAISGVRRVTYKIPPRATTGCHGDARDFEHAMARADAVARAARQVKMLGFEPDIIIGHHGWGELLNLGDIWSGVPLLGYHEFYYHLHNLDVGFDPEFPVEARAFSSIRAKNAVNLLALTNPGFGLTPTQFQLDTYPEWSRSSITLLAEGVNLDVCQPKSSRGTVKIGDISIKPSEKLVTYVARDLEPYRGFHVALRAMPDVLAARKDVRVVMVGGDGVSYGARLASGSWREHFLREVGDKIDLDRVHFPGRLPYADYVRLLQRSDTHIYMTYPFVASWSLREAMACGCAVIGSDTAPVREFITHGKTGLLTPFFEPETLAENVLEQLENGAAVQRRRLAARKWAEENLRMDSYLEKYVALIEKLTGRPVQSRPEPVRKSAGRKRSTK